jgi:hypothetical protein
MKNNLTLLSIFSIACVFGLSVVVRADTFVILLDVNGFYNGGQDVNFEFDLGTALTEVNSARFICEGSITAGLDYWGDPISDQFEARLLTGTNYMYARGPFVGAGMWPDPEPFSCDSVFSPAFGATWDFLLDGHTTGCVLLTGVEGPISYPPQLNSCGTITSASIIIEATPVPLEADINGNGKVNLVDFAILAGQWRQAPGQPSADIAPSGGDGVVTRLDLGVLCDYWLEGTEP